MKKKVKNCDFCDYYMKYRFPCPLWPCGGDKDAVLSST